MTPTRFKQVVEEIINHCQKILLEKNDEYSRNGDRLWNFKIAGRKLGAPPEVALLGMKIKHTVSIEDIVNDVVNGAQVPDKEYLFEKFGDEINYNLLLLALLLERKDKEDA